MLVSHEASRTGAPRVAIELAEALRAAGWQVVLVHRWGGPLKPQLDAAADRSMMEPMARAQAILRRSRRTRGIAWRLRHRAVARAFDRVRPDLVWCNTVLPLDYAVEARRRAIPVVAYSHEQADLVAGALARTGLGGSAGHDPGITWAACSPEAGTVLADGVGIEGEQVTVVTSPVDGDRVRREAAAGPTLELPHPIVVACATGDDRKGIDVFTAAAERSGAEGDDITWCWVGSVAADRRHPAVRYAGEVHQAAPWLAAADVVAVPSRAEAFPLVVLEAMALGRPVVGSDIAALRFQLGEDGRLVPAGDSAALLQGVRDAIADPAGSQGRGRALRDRADRRWGVAPFRSAIAELADRAAAAAAVPD
jgi:glycosyltransferase involved in cell wall biosynthesis